MKRHRPPKWLDRFLKWYCDPELLEEFQGDVRELYFERLENEGKFRADIKYAYDILRFYQWNNIRKPGRHRKPNRLEILIYSGFKMAVRNAGRNRLSFLAKTLTISICVVFSLILFAYAIQEYSYDQFIPNSNLVFRVGTEVEVNGAITKYAVSPTALASAISELPTIEYATRFSCLSSLHHYEANGQTYYQEKGIITDSKFPEIFGCKFLRGSGELLDEPDNIVLTLSTAVKFFGIENPVGKTVTLNNGFWMDVVGIIEDPPGASHLKYDMLLSRSSFDVPARWQDLDAYTYCKLKKESDIHHISSSITQILTDHENEITQDVKFARGQVFGFRPILQNITGIHLHDFLNEDVAVKRDIKHLHFIVLLASLFYLSAIISFLNISMSDLTANFKQLGILQVFSGSSGGASNSFLANTLFKILLILPIAAILLQIGLNLTGPYLGITIEESVYTSKYFFILVASLITLLILSSKIGSFLVVKSVAVLDVLKGNFNIHYGGVRLRELLLTVQLSFSVLMISLTLVILDQFEFISKTDKGFEDRNTLVIKIPVVALGSSTLLESLEELAGVKMASPSSFDTDVQWKEVFEVKLENGVRSGIFNYQMWGEGFGDLMNIEMVMGRGFTGNSANDKSVCLVNQTAVEEFGWKNPIGKIITSDLGETRVTGVVKDFKTVSIHNKIEPMIILADRGWSEYLYVKLEPIHSTNLIYQIEKTFNDHHAGAPFSWNYLDAKLFNWYHEDYQIRGIMNIGFIVSIIISCLVVFSISSQWFMLRTKEMSIRKVVGAGATDLFVRHVSKFLKFTAIAILIAFPLVYYLSNYWLQNFAYRINLEVSYFLVPGLLTFLITILVSGFHGIHNSKINVSEVLKES